MKALIKVYTIIPTLDIQVITVESFLIKYKHTFVDFDTENAFNILTHTNK